MSNQVNGGSLCDDCPSKDSCDSPSKGMMGKGPVFGRHPIFGDGLIAALGMLPMMDGKGAMNALAAPTADLPEGEAVPDPMGKLSVEVMEASPSFAEALAKAEDTDMVSKVHRRPFAPNKYQSKPVVALIALDHPLRIGVGDRLHGAAYGHPNFPNGSPVVTSSIVGITIKGRMAEVETRNTMYHVPLAA